MGVGVFMLMMSMVPSPGYDDLGIRICIHIKLMAIKRQKDTKNSEIYSEGTKPKSGRSEGMLPSKIFPNLVVINLAHTTTKNKKMNKNIVGSCP